MTQKRVGKPSIDRHKKYVCVNCKDTETVYLRDNARPGYLCLVSPKYTHGILANIYLPSVSNKMMTFVLISSVNSKIPFLLVYLNFPRRCGIFHEDKYNFSSS